MVYCEVYTILYLYKMSIQWLFLFWGFELNLEGKEKLFLYFNSHYKLGKVGIMTANEIWFRNALNN